jgi:hypothetical protein
MHVLEMGPPLRRGRRRSFCVGATFVASQFLHEYIRAVTASKSVWALCTLCHCTVLSNIYTRYTSSSSIFAWRYCCRDSCLLDALSPTWLIVWSQSHRKVSLRQLQCRRQLSLLMNDQFLKESEASAKLSEVSDRVSSTTEINSSVFIAPSPANRKQTSNWHHRTSSVVSLLGISKERNDNPDFLFRICILIPSKN